jgi:cytochrome P450
VSALIATPPMAARPRARDRGVASTCARCRPTSTPTPTRCTPRCAKHEPVKRMPDGSFFLTRHADLVAVYRDAQTFSSDKKVEFDAQVRRGLRAVRAPHHQPGVQRPAAAHARAQADHGRADAARDCRHGARAGHTGRRPARCDREAKGGGDLVEDFASAIPVEIIGNLLGVPHATAAPLRGWSLAILGALEPRLTPSRRRWATTACASSPDYLRDLVADRRRHPGDPEHDVLTRLIQGEGGEQLSETSCCRTACSSSMPATKPPPT